MRVRDIDHLRSSRRPRLARSLQPHFLDSRGQGGRLNTQKHGRAMPAIDFYLRRMRVPRMLSLLSVPRKDGNSRSISSKYEESAGVFWDVSYRISSR